MIDKGDFIDAFAHAVHIDGTSWIRLGKTPDDDARDIALVLGYIEGYDEDDTLYQIGQHGHIYTLVGKIAVNIDDLQCDYDCDWYMPWTDDGTVYDTETAIVVGDELSNLDWWDGECKRIMACLKTGTLKYK